jgi:hypothetical protein
MTQAGAGVEPAVNMRLQSALIALCFISISLLFFNKIFTSDYGIHLSIGKHIVETGKIPDREFLIYPNLNNPVNFEEMGFQVILYSVYRLVGTEGVSVFVWLMATLSFFFVYKSLRARDIHPYIVLLTMLLFAMPFRIRLQPRPEIIAYFFTSYLIYACSLFYYKGNRRILYSIPFVFLVWANIHPSTLAGIGTLGAFGTQSLVVIYKDKFTKTTLKNNLFIPLGIFVLSILATFLSKHGFDSVLTPVRLMTSSEQMTGISEMASIVNSGFYPYYKYLLVLTVVFGAAGLISFRIKIPDIILAIYGMRLPLMVARGMAFMSIFSIPLVAQSFDGLLKRIREVLDKREDESREREGIPEKEAGEEGGPLRRCLALLPSDRLGLACFPGIRRLWGLLRPGGNRGPRGKRHRPHGAQVLSQVGRVPPESRHQGEHVQLLRPGGVHRVAGVPAEADVHRR